MKRKLVIISTLGTILSLILIFLTESITFFTDLFNYVISYSNQFKEDIGWIATIVSIVMYIKLRFFDTKMFSKLQKTYGKQKFIASLEVILEMLDVYDPEEIMKKILMISEMEVDMRKALNEIKAMLFNNETNKPIIKLNRFESRRMQKEIKQLLQLIDKSMEIHYLAKDIKLSNKEKIAQIGEMFESNIIKSRYKRKRIDEYINNKRAKSKDKIIKEFNNKNV